MSRYFPVAHIIKLYPAGRDAKSWSNPASLNRGLCGNVFTYQLDVQKIANMVTGDMVMPPPGVLAATIGITFIGPTSSQNDYYQTCSSFVEHAL